jgi:hypothetical protein
MAHAVDFRRTTVHAVVNHTVVIECMIDSCIITLIPSLFAVHPHSTHIIPQRLSTQHHPLQSLPPPPPPFPRPLLLIIIILILLLPPLLLFILLLSPPPPSPPPPPLTTTFLLPPLSSFTSLSMSRRRILPPSTRDPLPVSRKRLRGMNPSPTDFAHDGDAESLSQLSEGTVTDESSKPSLRLSQPDELAQPSWQSTQPFQPSQIFSSLLPLLHTL